MSTVKTIVPYVGGFVKGALVLLVLALGQGRALAQQAVVTQPNGVTSVNVSGTISASGNTFQQVIPVGGTTSGGAGKRNGCLIQNTGTGTQYVYVHQGTGGTPTTGTSFQLVPPSTGVQGGSFSCATGGGGVIQDQIDITGTQNDTFTATYQ